MRAYGACRCQISHVYNRLTRALRSYGARRSGTASFRLCWPDLDQADSTPVQNSELCCTNNAVAAAAAAAALAASSIGAAAVAAAAAAPATTSIGAAAAAPEELGQGRGYVRRQGSTNVVLIHCAKVRMLSVVNIYVNEVQRPH